MSNSVYFKNLNIFNAERFKEYVSQIDGTSVYFTIGQCVPWTNENLPPNANSSAPTLYEVYKNMIGGKKITGNDVYHAIPRIQWAQNNTYAEYDDAMSTQTTANFYVVTSNWDVYKCISNNRSASSTVLPTQKNTGVTIEEADGYIWKYMYTISPAEILRFTTSDYIPVKTLQENDNSLQWSVQEGAIPGSIQHIRVVNPGTGYTSAANISITITGDGAGATAKAKVNTITNTISSIAVETVGSGYTFADVAVTDGLGLGGGAVLKAVISPPGGHGSDPVSELGGNNLIINMRLRYDEDQKLPVTNDFRQVAMIENPHVFGTDTVKTNTVFSQLTTLSLSGVGDDDYYQDEIVYQGVSVSNATFSAIVVEWNGTTDTIKLSNVRGIPTSDPLIGANSRAYGIVSLPYTDPDLEPYTGKLLYVDNITPIRRSTDQVEDFKIVFKF